MVVLLVDMKLVSEMNLFLTSNFKGILLMKWIIIMILTFFLLLNQDFKGHCVKMIPVGQQ